MQKRPALASVFAPNHPTFGGGEASRTEEGGSGSHNFWYLLILAICCAFFFTCFLLYECDLVFNFFISLLLEATYTTLLCVESCRPVLTVIRKMQFEVN